MLQNKIKVKLSNRELIAAAIANEGAVIAANGALVVETGNRTGRSPTDRFIVKDDLTATKVSWGDGNQEFAASNFTNLWDKAKLYLGENYYASVMQVGASKEHGFNIEVKTEYAWHHLFLRHLFISNNMRAIPSDRTWELISAPNLKLDPAIDKVNSDAAVILSMATQQVLICGMRYAGEMKKAMFSCLNFILPDENVLPMHCAANMSDSGDVSLFFGLSGTGKTTLSADPSRALLGDDEHGWSDTGIFNFEGGCYAKCINLNQQNEQVIWNAIRDGAIMENVVLNSKLEPDYTNISLTENTRAAYPRAFITNKVLSNQASHPNKVFFLCCDLYGVMPPIAKLSPEQAAYYFLSGYTAKVGSTEIGSSSAISPTFSFCFGAPFFARPPQDYANLLLQRLAETNAEVFLVNTGWTNGSYSNGGHRFELATTRAILTAVMENKVNTYKKSTTPYFDFMIPSEISGIAESTLDPASARTDAEFTTDAANLAKMFQDNFSRFEITTDIAAAGPEITT